MKDLNKLKKMFIKTLFTKDEMSPEDKVEASEQFSEMVDSLEELEVTDEEVTPELSVEERLAILEQWMYSLKDKEEVVTDEDEEVKEDELIEDEEVLIEEDETKEELVEDACEEDEEAIVTKDSLNVVFSKAKVLVPTLKLKNKDSITNVKTLNLLKKQVLAKTGKCKTLDSLTAKQIAEEFEAEFNKVKQANNSAIVLKTQDSRKFVDLNEVNKNFWANK